jgi:hypothetical protein
MHLLPPNVPSGLTFDQKTAHVARALAELFASRDAISPLSIAPLISMLNEAVDEGRRCRHFLDEIVRNAAEEAAEEAAEAQRAAKAARPQALIIPFPSMAARTPFAQPTAPGAA